MQTKGSSKLTSPQRKQLILQLCQSLSVLKTPAEVADALTDLLTPKEIETIAKRLKIAELLVNKKDYSFIRTELKVGLSTISRVNTWLNLSGEGYRIMLTRRKQSPKPISDEEKYDPFSWHNIKRRYSLYFWPQLLLEELLKTSDTKQRQKIEATLEKLHLKKRRFNQAENKRLYQMFSQRFQPQPTLTLPKTTSST